MPPHRFLSQQQLVNWSDEGQIDARGDQVLVIAERKNWRIREAVRFLKLVSGEDKASLLARVKTIQQLKDLGAEHYLDSVILGEAAYEVQQGYLVEADGAAAATAAVPAQKLAPPPAAAAFARFVLSKIQ